MIRQVDVLPRAKNQLYDAALWWADHRSLEEAAHWLTEIESAIQELGRNAEQWPLASESSQFDFELRQLSFGVSRRPTHRVLFSIQGNRVVIYAVRHLAQKELTPQDLE